MPATTPNQPKCLSRHTRAAFSEIIVADMRYPRLTCRMRSALLMVLIYMPLSALAQDVRSTETSTKAPLMKLLHRFEASSVPAMSAEEAEAPNL